MEPNPESLTKRQILDLIKNCPICSTPWPEGKLECANKNAEEKDGMIFVILLCELVEAED